MYNGAVVPSGTRVYQVHEDPSFTSKLTGWGQTGTRGHT